MLRCFDQRIARPIRDIFIILAILFLGPAFAIDRCMVDGQATYTDRDCPNNAAVTAFTRQVLPANDPLAASTRAQAEKRALEQINKQKAHDEAEQKRADFHALWQARINRQHQIHCSNLELRRQLATQQRDDAKQHGDQKKFKTTQLKVLHAENNYALLCKSE